MHKSNKNQRIIFICIFCHKKINCVGGFIINKESIFLTGTTTISRVKAADIDISEEYWYKIYKTAPLK